MELLFKILAVILGGVAAYFIFNGDRDGAFVAAVFAAVSFFLSVRFQVKARIKRREAENEAAEEEEWNDEDDAGIDYSGSPQLNDVAASGQFDELPSTAGERRPKDVNRL